MGKDVINYKNDSENVYSSIRSYVISAQNKVYSAANSAMVAAYWEIGEQIYNACGENDRAEYGKKLLQYISERLTAEFGQGYTVRNLRAMRQFYCCYQNRHTLCADLSWSHYRILMRINDKTDKLTHQDLGQMQMYVNYYTRELMNPGDNPPIGIVLCAEKNDAVVRYTLPENNNQIFASKYLTYLPSEDELKRELRIDNFKKKD